MSMIRKRSHPSGGSTKKEKATQPETGKLRICSVSLKRVMVGRPISNVFAQLFEQIVGPVKNHHQKDGQ